MRRIVEAAPDAGIGVLTLFAFSADNWRRARAEVGWLMRLFREYLRVETRALRRQRRPARGDRPARPASAPRSGSAIEDAQRATAGGTRLHLRIALDYSSRDAILRAAQCLRPETRAVARLVRRACWPSWTTALPVPEVDLLIRTGGERRLSDFLLWEAAYAELLFSPYVARVRSGGAGGGGAGLCERQRRFGGLPDAGAREA